MQNLLNYHKKIDPPPEVHSFLKNKIETDEFYDPAQEIYTSYLRDEVCSEIQPFYDKIIRRALFDLTISFADFEQSIWCQIYKPSGDSFFPL